MKDDQLLWDPVDPLIGIDPPAESPQPPDYDNPWIDCEDELPPCDGHYQILDDTNKFWAVAFYDGFGFLFQDVYRIPKFWKKYLSPKKRYGKIKKLPPGV